ncbi:MAG TPA: FtsX-like permease family protein [Thermoanaerobaculaceae bacterium]|nr:FtsX-like permease family protein [Thermoanaerobaculaceae bacterium]
MIDHIRIAEAQLRGRPRQTAIALASVGVGSAMLIVTLSLTSGLSDDFLKKTTESSPHVEVLARRPQGWKPEKLSLAGEAVTALSRHHIPDEKRAIRELSGVLSALRSLPSVRVATPAVEAQAVLVYGTVRCAAVLSGVVPEPERAVTSLDTKVVAGSWPALSAAPDGVILGSQVARTLAVEVGSHLQAVGPDGGVVALRVVAIVASGLSRIDKTLALVNLPLAQALAGLSTDQATTVRIALANPLEAPAVARMAERLTGYVCRSWQEKSAASVEAFNRQNMITLALVFFTTLVAAFGVANVLVQLVADKRRDIAILRAAGFSRHDLAMIFLHEGALLGLLGSAVGWLLGGVLIRVVAALPVDFGESALMRNEHLQMAERPGFYLMALLVSVVVCALAAVQPARRAASLEPTAILRGEH